MINLPIPSLIRELVPSFNVRRTSNPKFIEISPASLLIQCYPFNNFFAWQSFFFLILLLIYFHRNLYEGLHESRNFYFQIFILCINLHTYVGNHTHFSECNSRIIVPVTVKKLHKAKLSAILTVHVQLFLNCTKMCVIAY